MQTRPGRSFPFSNADALGLGAIPESTPPADCAAGRWHHLMPRQSGRLSSPKEIPSPSRAAARLQSALSFSGSPSRPSLLGGDSPRADTPTRAFDHESPRGSLAVKIPPPRPPARELAAAIAIPRPASRETLAPTSAWEAELTRRLSVSAGAGSPSSPFGFLSASCS
eukprot:tig00021179_g19267.t1